MRTLDVRARVLVSGHWRARTRRLHPGTKTQEPGGWTTRELIRILRVGGLNVEGADGEGCAGGF
ncbi:hypothetical protein TRIATDRAFT_298627 [Trichoderma atroviride IMI 206040]|uniref:Uncharacterized protein n=1 Tax=Hypocrea atroviridis (strain ATCC 20476 / IMI 206040) TaxID=452589 RepID=G9NNA3_HYPAI|nr:uncharacterized protein TRIATDRAFT_298627 [Trichoderma atroviride IMI 206040]EHK47552.1 hypothetical protein TRIATDRAFT_298627 [Trichoderma atroviride IMI 206040]